MHTNMIPVTTEWLAGDPFEVFARVFYDTYGVTIDEVDLPDKQNAMRGFYGSVTKYDLTGEMSKIECISGTHPNNVMNEAFKMHAEAKKLFYSKIMCGFTKWWITENFIINEKVLPEYKTHRLLVVQAIVAYQNNRYSDGDSIVRELVTLIAKPVETMNIQDKFLIMPSVSDGFMCFLMNTGPYVNMQEGLRLFVEAFSNFYPILARKPGEDSKKYPTIEMFDACYVLRKLAMQ